MNNKSRSQSRITIRDQETFAPTSHNDWHPADIKAALEKRGLTLSEISRRAGYHATAAGRALRQPWPELERIIAEALGMKPHLIWPSRYTRDGFPLKYVMPRRREKPTKAATQCRRNEQCQ